VEQAEHEFPTGTKHIENQKEVKERFCTKKSKNKFFGLYIMLPNNPQN